MNGARPIRPAGGSNRNVWVLIGAALAAVALCVSLLSGSLLLAALIALLPLLFVTVWYELKRAADPGHPPIGLIAIVLFLPFFQLAANNNRTLYLIWQGCSLIVVLFYLSAERRPEARAAVRSVLPMIVVFEVLSLTGALTLFITGALDSRAILSAGIFALSGVYLLVGALLRTWARSSERASRILVYGGLLQLPVVIAEATGLTDRLGSGLVSRLSSTLYGGAIEAATIVRYPGSFIDYELFAEWLGILLIIAVGGVMYTRGWTRIMLAISVAAILGMGFLTATRGFLIAVALVAVVVVPGALLSRRGRSFTGPLTAAAAVLAAYFLVPDVAVEGTLTRLLQAQTTGVNAFNRLPLFTEWWRLVGRMPWYGYGWGAPTLDNALATMHVGFPHSLYFYFALTAGWPGFLALVVFVGMVIFSAWGGLLEGKVDTYRTLVLGVAVAYWAVSQAKIEFVRLVFYGDLLLVLFGIIAADHWLGLRLKATAEEPERSSSEAAADATLAPSYRISNGPPSELSGLRDDEVKGS